MGGAGKLLKNSSSAFMIIRDVEKWELSGFLGKLIEKSRVVREAESKGVDSEAFSFPKLAGAENFNKFCFLLHIATNQISKQQ